MTDNVVSLFGQRSVASGPRLRPEKLQKARRAKAFTQTELASRIGLTRQAVSAYEQGAKAPEPDTLVRIAEELGQPLGYFTTEARSAFGPFSARTYRAFGSATKKRNEQCDELTEWLAVIAAYLDEAVQFPDPQVPAFSPSTNNEHYDDEEIEQAAETVRREWGLGPGPIGNLTKLIESRGVFVGHLPVDAGDVNAFSYWSGSRPFIVSGADKTTAVRRRFDLAHELGHLVLHQGVGAEELEDRAYLKRIEAEANRFAGAFLLPRSSYPNEVFSSRLMTFVPLKERWKVAISAQVYRCADLGILTDGQVLSLRKQISAKKWRTWEPFDDKMMIEKPTVLAKAARMAIDGKVLTGPGIINDLKLGPSIVANVLGLGPSEIKEPNEPDPTVQLRG